jgi:hypothetical protein
LFVGIILLGIAGMAGLMIRFSSPDVGAWILLIGALPIAASFIAGLVLLDRLDRRRIGRVAEALGAVGFRTNIDPNDDAKAAVLEPIGHLV